uniref:TLDc domain-containing protein n=1 Tax=Macrostomum lignano TaxID=282301 RepID=A0A1I8HW49_9PLAT
VSLHGNNLSSFHRHLSPSLLPSELGGRLPPHDPRPWLARMTGKLGPSSSVSCGYIADLTAADASDNQAASSSAADLWFSAFGEEQIFWPSDREYRSFGKSVSMPAGILSNRANRVTLDEKLFLES